MRLVKISKNFEIFAAKRERRYRDVVTFDARLSAAAAGSPRQKTAQRTYERARPDLGPTLPD